MSRDELHFELVFLTSPGKRNFRRVIVTDDLIMAKRIADAMLGEIVPGEQTLQSVERVDFTGRPPIMGTMSTFEDSKNIWERVLERLEIDPDSVTCLHDFPYGEQEIVGFTAKKEAE